MSNKKIRIAIIGCGGIAKNAHIPAYQNSADLFEIVAACDIIPERAEKFAKDYKIPKHFTDYKDVLKLKNLDAVDICTPNYLHSIIGVEAAQAGLHVLCEKPDAKTPQEAAEMKEAAEAAGVTLMVIRNNRFLTASQFMKKYIGEGGLGNIYAARCGWQRRRGIPGKGGWFTTKEMSGGGPLIDLGVHMIDLTLWLMGNPRPVAVSGSTYCEFAKSDVSDSINSAYGDAKSEGTFDVEDLAMGFIRFENGACMQIEFSWASNIERENRFFELRGNKAGCEWNSNDNKLKIFTEQFGKTADYLPNLGKSAPEHQQNIRNFGNVILGTEKPVFLPEQGIDMIKILTAIYESAETGKEVRL